MHHRWWVSRHGNREIYDIMRTVRALKPLHAFTQNTCSITPVLEATVITEFTNILEAPLLSTTWLCSFETHIQPLITSATNNFLWSAYVSLASPSTERIGWKYHGILIIFTHEFYVNTWLVITILQHSMSGPKRNAMLSTPRAPYFADRERVRWRLAAGCEGRGTDRADVKVYLWQFVVVRYIV